MAITGAHALFHTPEPDALRQLLGDAFGWSNIDVGDGWLIFALPPGEIAVHPSDHPRHELSFFCDDLTSTIAELSAKGVEFRGEPIDEGYGVVITMVLPGGVEVLLYEPRHQTIA